MKHLFLLLLAINLGIFIWGYQREQNTARIKPVPRPDIGNLLLLSERKVPPPEVLKSEAVPIPTPQPTEAAESEVEPREKKVQVQVAEAPIQPAKEAFLTEASPASEVTDAEPEMEVVMAEESSEEAEPQQLATNEADIEDVAEFQSQVETVAEITATDIYTLPPVEAEAKEGVEQEMAPEDKADEVEETEEAEEMTEHAQLSEPEQPLTEEAEEEPEPDQVSEPEQLLAEEAEKKAEVVQTSEPETEPEETVVAEIKEPTIVKACYRLGPVDARPSAEKLADWLDSENLVTTIEEKEVKKQSGYWVLFPPSESTQEALKKLREIKASGINDVWRFTSGKLRNAISLGLFKLQQNAEGVKKRAEEKGFFPELRPSFTQQTEYWLRFESVDQPPVQEVMLQRFQEEYANLELTPLPCSDVVTP